MIELPTPIGAARTDLHIRTAYADGPPVERYLGMMSEGTLRDAHDAIQSEKDHAWDSDQTELYGLYKRILELIEAETDGRLASGSGF